MINVKGLGKDFKLRRTALDLTQKKLSDISGVSTATISKIERGDSNVSLDTLEKVSDAMESLVLLQLVAS